MTVVYIKSFCLIMYYENHYILFKEVAPVKISKVKIKSLEKWEERDRALCSCAVYYALTLNKYVECMRGMRIIATLLIINKI